MNEEKLLCGLWSFPILRQTTVDSRKEFYTLNERIMRFPKKKSLSEDRPGSSGSTVESGEQNYTLNETIMQFPKKSRGQGKHEERPGSTGKEELQSIG